MKNKKIYPFERNNYFYGKLLSVRDFSDEQKYNNDKRRLDNIITKGCGVINGLNVVIIDDKTISVEAGIAIDYFGREIIVEEGVSKKLNIIDGFYELENLDNVYLGIDYDEKKEELVHSIAMSSGDDNSAQYNRIKEGYRLFLTDKVEDDVTSNIQEIMKRKVVIYNADGLKITQYFPKYVKKGECFETEIEIEKINLPRAINIDYSIETDVFKNENGDSKLRIFYSDDDITAYKKVKTSYILKADEAFIGDAILQLIKNESNVIIGNQTYPVTCDDVFPINVTDKNINEKIVHNYIQKNFNDVVEKNSDKSIYLAKFRIIRRNEEYLIDYCENLPFNQYIVSNEMLYELINRGNFNNTRQPEIIQKSVDATPKVTLRKDEDFFASGTETIEIEPRCKNKSYFSDEISHGLGNGDVFIECGVEEDSEDDSFYNIKKTFMGNTDVFLGSIYESELPPLDTGIISYTEKGTFKIGVKFYDDFGKTTVNVKWWAFKNDKNRKRDLSEINGVNVFISPDTVTVRPRECFKFNAEITGTDVKECKWNVTEKDGGKIDIDGVYEAPTKEGVFEITVQSVAYPNKKATAFVVVKE